MVWSPVNFNPKSPRAAIHLLELRLLNSPVVGRSLQAEVFEIFKYQCKQSGETSALCATRFPPAKASFASPCISWTPRARMEGGLDPGDDDAPEISALIWSLASILGSSWLSFG